MLSLGYAVRALEAHGIQWEIRDGVLWGVAVLAYPDGRTEDEVVPTESVRALKEWLGY
jgi:hypothetical protein